MNEKMEEIAELKKVLKKQIARGEKIPLFFIFFSKKYGYVLELEVISDQKKEAVAMDKKLLKKSH